MQPLFGRHDVGQAPGLPAGIALSHFSAPSTVPLPQVAEQSTSDTGVQPVAQQPSAGPHAVTGSCAQVAEHCAAVPSMTSVVHGLLSLQSVMTGQAPSLGATIAGSQ